MKSLINRWSAVTALSFIVYLDITTRSTLPSHFLCCLPVLNRPLGLDKGLMPLSNHTPPGAVTALPWISQEPEEFTQSRGVTSQSALIKHCQQGGGFDTDTRSESHIWGRDLPQGHIRTGPGRHLDTAEEEQSKCPSLENQRALLSSIHYGIPTLHYGIWVGVSHRNVSLHRAKEKEERMGSVMGI